MKTFLATLVAGLALSITLGNANEAQAKDFRSFVNGAVQSVQQHRGSFQRQGNFAVQQKSNRNFDGGHGNWNPRPSCTPNYCPPPPPPVCHVHLVYYYDCHYGWKFYGQYHNHYAASQAVSSLQHQGYRAYTKKVRR